MVYYKPATTYFCKNGHLLEDNPIFQCGKYDDLLRNSFPEAIDVGDIFPECPCCKNKKTVFITDWHGKNKDLVSHIPVTEEGEGHIFYDVTKANAPKGINRRDISCLLCGRILEEELGRFGEESGIIYDGVCFKCYGNYGSAVFDPVPPQDGQYLKIFICDECLRRNEKKIELFEVHGTHILEEKKYHSDFFSTYGGYL